MSKRAPQFKRHERDFYATPEHAVVPLIPHLRHGIEYTEPCGGDGRLIDHLTKLNGSPCVDAFDLEPMREDIKQADALDPFKADLIITNPPWDRKILHPMINHFKAIAPTWLLFDSDWAYTKQAAAFLPYCAKIVSIGRVKWFDNKAGKDNAAWYLFGRDEVPTVFYGHKTEQIKLL